MAIVTQLQCDRLWRNARLMTMTGNELPYANADADGVIACVAGRIVYAGPESAAPPLRADDIIDCGGLWISPGFIDCHTHLVYGGNRAQEFEQRLNGISYEEIARNGGGILSTMRETRAASAAELEISALNRLDALLAEGVTTIEIKSGYGLSLESEMKMLRVARSLAVHRRINVTTTFLGAHAVPPEYIDDHDGYIDHICNTMIPEIARAGLADAVDVFCEGIGFTLAQTRRVFAAARTHDLPVKLHAEQLSNQHGAALAAAAGALSADHLEHLDMYYMCRYNKLDLYVCCTEAILDYYIEVTGCLVPLLYR